MNFKKQTVHQRKGALRGRILGRLDGTYTKESQVYRTVSGALVKLSERELDSLLVMVSTKAF